MYQNLTTGTKVNVIDCGVMEWVKKCGTLRWLEHMVRMRISLRVYLSEVTGQSVIVRHQ